MMPMKPSTAWTTPTDAATETVMTEQNIAFALGEDERSQVFVNHAWKQYVQGDLTALSSSAKQGAVLFFGNAPKGATTTLFPNKITGGLVTQDPADNFRFRTPSLLNVAVAGPWGHNTHLQENLREMLASNTDMAGQAYREEDVN